MVRGHPQPSSSISICNWIWQGSKNTLPWLASLLPLLLLLFAYVCVTHTHTHTHTHANTHLFFLGSFCLSNTYSPDAPAGGSQARGLCLLNPSRQSCGQYGVTGSNGDTGAAGSQGTGARAASQVNTTSSLSFEFPLYSCHPLRLLWLARIPALPQTQTLVSFSVLIILSLNIFFVVLLYHQALKHLNKSISGW